MTEVGTTTYHAATMRSPFEMGVIIVLLVIVAALIVSDFWEK